MLFLWHNSRTILQSRLFVPTPFCDGSVRLSPTLSLYIARQYIVAFLMVLVAVVSLIMLFDVIELIRRAAGHSQAGLMAVLSLAVLKMPHMAHMIMPFAVMIGAMVAFWRLTRTNELVIARAAGISAWEFLLPILGTVMAFGIFEITVINPVGAAMYARFERLQDEVLTSRGAVLDVSEMGLWLREGLDGNGQMVVHSDQVRQQGLQLDMKDVHIFIYDAPDHFLYRIAAGTASLEDGYFLLTDVWTMHPGQPSVHEDEVRLATALTLERVKDNFAAPETLSFWQLPGFIHFFEKAGFSAPKHRMYLQSLISSPILYCAMVLIAALFSLQPNSRSGGLLRRVVAGVATGFVLYFVSKVVYALGLSQSIPQFLAAWAPALIASFAGLGGLFHLEDG